VNIFIATSAYHILLAYAIILNENLLGDNYLFVHSSNNRIGYFLRVFKKTKQSFFNKVTILPSKCKRNSKFAKWN